MGELFEDRRQEPRFSTVGRYRLHTATAELDGPILDLSLNGALLEREANPAPQLGDRLTVSLEFEGQPAFNADVLVVRTESNHIGIEFYDMTPQHFSALSALIDALTRAHRKSGKDSHA